MDAPCKDCERRDSSCHGRCAEYKAYCEQHKAEKEAKQMQYEMSDYFIKTALKRRKKNRRK